MSCFELSVRELFVNSPYIYEVLMRMALHLRLVYWNGY